MKPETEYIIQILRTAMRVLGFSNKDIEAKLGVSGGYLTRLFNGSMELRFEHIVDIARGMGLEPEEVFVLAYPQPRKPLSQAAQRLRDTFAAPAPQPAAEPLLPPLRGGETPTGQLSSALASALEQEMERLMEKQFRKLFTQMMTRAAAVGE